MASPLPYLASNKNVPLLFEKIRSAKSPDKFTQTFLSSTIGLKGTNDRNMIPLLRAMGFLDQSGTPTTSYSLLKGHQAGAAIAEGMKSAYRQLFDADLEAQKLPADRLKSLIAQVAGTDADASSRIAATFNAIAKVADFDTEVSNPASSTQTVHDVKTPEPIDSAKAKSALRTEFHYNIQIHLPANGDEETYLNIFNAIRKTFQ